MSKLNEDIHEAVNKLKKLKVGSEQIEGVKKITIECKDGRMVFVSPRLYLISMGLNVAYQIRGKPDFENITKEDKP